MNTFYTRCLVIISLLSIVAVARSENIEIGVLTATSIQKKVYLKYVEEFEQQNPNVNVDLLFKSDAEFKVDLKNWLSIGQGPSILTWQGGGRLQQLVQKDHVHDLTRFFAKYELGPHFSQAAIDASSSFGRHYAIPVSYYHWGFYYRDSVFKKLNLSAPGNWDEFIKVCEALKDAGIVPITIGAKFNWPTGAWFDYLNLRINGLAFHHALLQGKESFSDARVVEVLNVWKQLIDADFFLQQNKAWSWIEAMPYLYHQKAGMTLMGNFFAGSMPEALSDDFRFFRFPIINPHIKVFEEAPLDLLVVPTYAKMTGNIEKLLLMFAGKAFQEELNEVSGMISPNMNARETNDYFVQQGQQTLAKAAGVSQFFDRDTSEGMATAAMPILTEFMQNADVANTIVALEAARNEHLLSLTGKKVPR